MECKPKLSLTSGLPWKFLSKSKILFYFTTYLRNFFMYWLFLWLLSVWEINSISLHLAEKKLRRNQNMDSKRQFLNPCWLLFSNCHLNCCCMLALESLANYCLPESLRRWAEFRLHHLPPSSISSYSPAIYTCTKHLPTQRFWDSHISCCTARCL